MRPKEGKFFRYFPIILMKKILGILTSVATVFTLAACSSGDSGPIKIGFVGPLTGDAAAYGVDTLNGVKFAVDQINAKGGLSGRMVQIVAEDGRCSGSDAASAAQKLVNVDKVVAILGGQCSGETLAVAPIAEAAKVPVISAISSSPDVTLAGDFVFRDYPSDALKTKAMAKWLKEKGYAKVAMITENTDFASAFRTSLKESVGADVVVFDEVVEPGTKDYRTLVTRLKGVKFDIFFPNGQTDATVAAMLQQLRDQGLKQPVVTHDVGDQLTLVDIAPDAVEGMYVINVPTSGEGGDFEKIFTEKYGAAQASIAFAAHAYDAAGVLFNVIASVGTDGSAIRDGLYAVKGYEGVVGNFHFDENGDVVGIPYVLKQFQDGKIVKVADITLD